MFSLRYLLLSVLLLTISTLAAPRGGDIDYVPLPDIRHQKWAFVSDHEVVDPALLTVIKDAIGPQSNNAFQATWSGVLRLVISCVNEPSSQEEVHTALWGMKKVVAEIVAEHGTSKESGADRQCTVV
ncbi:hypothetical protein ANO11243_040380 [Dothideomycetidae sp. 11243]|nr:hypothetical protein ANO11243_040380 [fungal sp. No.11243]